MKYPKQIVALLFIFFLSSCDKFLEVEPEFKFPEQLALTSLDGLESTVTGAFNETQSSNLYGGGLIANSEFLADNVESDAISDFSLSQLRTREMNSFNSQASGLWTSGYRAVHIANLVMENLPKFESEDPDLVAKLRAECYFIRAICHFEIVRMFAQAAGYTSDNSHIGIPIRLTPGSATEGGAEPRASVADVYAQVITDLAAAEEMLPTSRTARASSWAAAAFLAKVYFQLNDFQNAYAWSDKVIAQGGFSLTDSLKETYNLEGNTFNNEMIFQIINVETDIVNGPVTDRFRQSGSKKATYFMSSNFITVLQTDTIAGGKRSKELFKYLGGRWFTSKYDNTRMNVPVIRLAEMYLIRAESKAHLNYTAEEVRADYNIIRVRGGLPQDNTTTDQQDLLDIIRHERNLELAMEGDRYHEVKRLKSTFGSPVGDFSWDDPRIIYPIPQSEVDENPNMVQNTGY